MPYVADLLRHIENRKQSDNCDEFSAGQLHCPADYGVNNDYHRRKMPIAAQSRDQITLTKAKYAFIVFCNAVLGDVLYLRGILFIENSQRAGKSS
jgi:hypothetical protein